MKFVKLDGNVFKIITLAEAQKLVASKNNVYALRVSEFNGLFTYVSNKLIAKPKGSKLGKTIYGCLTATSTRFVEKIKKTDFPAYSSEIKAPIALSGPQYRYVEGSKIKIISYVEVLKLLAVHNQGVVVISKLNSPTGFIVGKLYSLNSPLPNSIYGLKINAIPKNVSIPVLTDEEFDYFSKNIISSAPVVTLTASTSDTNQFGPSILERALAKASAQSEVVADKIGLTPTSNRLSTLTNREQLESLRKLVGVIPDAQIVAAFTSIVDNF